MNGAGGLGLGDGLAGQLLSVSAFKPMIDKILSEAGFPSGPDALTSLTSALAQRKAEVAPDNAIVVPPPAE
jgi:flotillin